jgi:epoxyqueuosine reductase QueG
LEDIIRKEIVNFITHNPANRLPDSDSPYFDEPLVAFSSAADPIFTDYKRIIGQFHLLPAELLPDAASVISWVLPISLAVRTSNRKQTDLPSREWSLTRTHGEAVNAALRRHLVSWLEGMNHKAVAPQYSPMWQEFPESPVGIASTWSERHAAYAAGLGTFSLSDGFISRKGIAHRCGSVITSLQLLPSGRTSTDHRQNCLYHRDQSCGACIARCPVGAISDEGHDKMRCREFVYTTVLQKLSKEYGVAQLGCGLCQTKVPCEAMIPSGRSKE